MKGLWLVSERQVNSSPEGLMFCYLRFLVVLSSACAVASTADVGPLFSINISTDANVFRVGDAIKVRVIFRNISNEEILLSRNPGIGVGERGEIFTRLELRTSNGQIGPETKYYRALQGKVDPATVKTERPKSKLAGSAEIPPPPQLSFRSVRSERLKPGEIHQEEIVLNKLYDLTQPGQYTVSASRRLLDVPAEARYAEYCALVKSNTLTITIIQ